MRRNLDREIRYVYFLRSSADAKRWLDFRQLMAREDSRANELMSAYIVEFAQADFWERNAAFIALSRDKEPQGYGLRVNRMTNQVIAGFELRTSKIQEIVNKLAPTVGSPALNRWELVVPASKEVEIAAVCVSLYRKATEEEFDRVDGELASEASAFNGEVALYGNKSIIVVFVNDDRLAFGLDRAVGFARRSMQRVALSLSENFLRIGLVVGKARRVPRACGLVWTGASVRGCRELLYEAPERRGAFLSAEAGKAFATRTAETEAQIVPLGDPWHMFELAYERSSDSGVQSPSGLD